MTPITVKVQNFRVLQNLQWDPEGCCLLVGPNGSGKSTTLAVLLFLRTLFSLGHEAAFAAIGGAEHFRRIGTDDKVPVVFEVRVGDVLWKLHFPMSYRGLSGTFGEELYHGGKPILRAALYGDRWFAGTSEQLFDPSRCCARVYWDREEPQWMRPLQIFLDSIRVYKPFCLEQVRRPESLGVHYLNYTGKNLWAVLQQWQSAKSRYPGQFEWVIAEAKRALPETFDRLEFDRGQALFFIPGSFDPAEGMAPDRAADGLLTALLQLTAVAGAARGSLVALDEFGNNLHPHALRSMLAGITKWAQEHDLTVLLTTHSTVVLNAFNDHEHTFVMGMGEAGKAHSLAALLDLHDEDWLAQAKLGSLYERLAFGAPSLPASSLPGAPK